jgi:hypothetical protein
VRISGYRQSLERLISLQQLTEEALERLSPVDSLSWGKEEEIKDDLDSPTDIRPVGK